jgi:protein-tyrosine phosphatase
MQRRRPLLPPIDATELLPELYQGSAPPPGSPVAAWGFDALVLSAKEFQPPAAAYPGVQIIRARLDDSGLPMTSDEWRQALRAAEHAANVVLRGGRVLVTCVMGRNRSGLVSALAIYLLTGLPGTEIVREVKRRRPEALSNQWFVGALERLPARRQPRRTRAEEEAW